jgi:hypothetical protein
VVDPVAESANVDVFLRTVSEGENFSQLVRQPIAPEPSPLGRCHGEIFYISSSCSAVELPEGGLPQDQFNGLDFGDVLLETAREGDPQWDRKVNVWPGVLFSAGFHRTKKLSLVL